MMMNDMNSTRIAVRVAVVAIAAMINHYSLKGIYRLIVRDMRDMFREPWDISKAALINMAFIMLNDLTSLIALACILLESEKVE